MRLLFELINFLLLFGGLVWLYRRYRLGRFFDNYRARVATEIQRAQEAEAEAERLRSQAEEELARAGERAQEILESARRAGARLREEYRASARAEAERILAQARQELARLEQAQHQAEWQADDLRLKLAAAEENLYSGRVRNPKELLGLQEEA
ncbi:MAG: ATP synthase F0 subunit B, partial [Candidatus Bipolaricaulia bacterium]